MTASTITLILKRFRDSNDKPTRIRNIADGDICKFFRT